MEFIETPIFTQLLPGYLGDDDYHGLQFFLTRSPEAGDIIPGTRGFRKLRWADPRRGKGKRGGLRVIYYYLMADTQIWFMSVYDKDEAADLSGKEKRVLKAAIEWEIAQRSRRKPRKK